MPSRRQPRLVLARDIPVLPDVPNRPVPAPGWVRLAHGIHAPEAEWAKARAVERHRALVDAALAQYAGELALAGVSAAVMLGIPVVGRLPERVQTIGGANERRRTSLLERHVRPGAELVEHGGVRLTPPAMTSVDLARAHGIMAGVVAMDALLHRGEVSKRDLERAIAALPDRARGIAAARSALHVADGLAESVGESVSRVRMWEAGLPRPRLQATVEVGDGARRVDHLWDELGVFGEFDGRIKFRSASFGQDPEEAVWDEYVRDADLRAQGLIPVHWTWDDVWFNGGRAMLAKLERVGIRPTGRRW